MSQDVSTNQGVRDPLTPPPPIQPWSAEAEANKLMDELFSDIDRILDGGSKLPTEPIKPEYISLQPIVIPKITMPTAVISPQELLQQPNPEVTEDKQIEPLETDLVHTPSPSPRRFGWSFEKLLLAVGLASIVVTALLLLASQKKLTWPGSKNVGVLQSGMNRQISDSDQQFAAYALRSLNVIDHKTKGKSPTQAGAAGATDKNNAQASSTVNPSPNSNQPPTVLERVYIPVPQNPRSLAPGTLPPAARLTAPPPSAAVRPPAQPPAAAVRPPAQPPAGAARPPAPAPARAAKPAAQPPSVAARPPAPAPARAAKPAAPAQVIPPPPAPQRAAAPPSAVVPSPAPPANSTLVGLVEFGDRPVALINIDGVVQRINVGEAIGNSGWTLFSINKQEAVIRRNGEVRSVYAGQKF